MSVIKCIFNYFKKHRIIFVFTLLVIISVTFLSLVPPQLLKIIVDDLSSSNNISHLWIYALLYMLIFIAIGIINFLKERLDMKIVVLDGYTENPGDISWAPLEKLGEVTVYDRTSYVESPLIAERIGDAEVVVINKTPISKETIDKCPNLKGIAVLATGYNVVDYDYAKEKGIDFIICDHHVPDDVLPPAVAILNAKRPDATYPYEHLSGCGVGFKFMQAFALNNGIEFNQLTPLLDLVAVSVASDIVPIMGENRVLTYHGLKQLNSNPSVGLKAIIDICGLSEKEITVGDIVFKIGPRINASGRIQNGKEAVELLIEKDFSSALEKANLINQYNETRKDLDKTMTEEANHIVDSLEGLADRRTIVIYNEAWHKGVIGIVASRLTEIYYRPAVVLTRTDNLATGSARSVSGFDVYKAIENCRDLLENFGGHTYAAGLSMKVENVEEFTHRFETYVSEHILPEQTSAVIDIDAEIDFRDITPKFHADLKKFNPFGPDNHKPVFCTHNVYDYGTSKVVGRDQEHIKLELVDNKSNNVMNGIAFGQSSQARYIKTKRSFDISYRLKISNLVRNRKG